MSFTYPKEELEELLKTKTIRQVGIDIGVKYTTLYSYIRRNNIKYNDVHNVSRKTENYLNNWKKYKKLNNDEEVIELYNDGLSMAEIGKKFNVSAATVLHLLRRNKIKFRLRNGKDEYVKPRFSKEILYDLYIEKNMSSYDIAELLNYPNHTLVTYDLKKHGIKLRNYKDAGANMVKMKPEVVEKWRNILNKNRARNWIANPSSLEIIFMEWCINNDINYVSQFQITPTGHCYDFLLRDLNLIVEIDGDYWHLSNDEQIKRDKFFEKVAHLNGFDIIRILGSEIKANGDKIFNEKILKYEYNT